MSTTIDIHILQSVPPANLNRDDSGSPKTATYGGVQRARVSSQAWKRVTRQHFSQTLSQEQTGVRTLRAVELIAERLSSLDAQTTETDRIAASTNILKAAGFKIVEKRRRGKPTEDSVSDAGQPPEVKTEYLVFFSNNQLDRLAALAAEGDFSAKSAKEALRSGNGVDLALFGRMVANDADLNVDASVQVAHAISTHPVVSEFDFYTAVDDTNPASDTGAGMMGTIEFNSATLYRYASLNVDALAKQLGDRHMTPAAVKAFIESFVLSMPTGKQNTFANNTLPDGVVVMVRRGRGISFVGAFETPIESHHGFVQPSAEALARYARDTSEQFAVEATNAWVVRVSDTTKALDDLGQRVALPALLSAVGTVVEEQLAL